MYYTSVEQTDHAELEIVSLVVRRSALLQKISEYRDAEAERRSWSKVEALKTLIALEVNNTDNCGCRAVLEGVSG